MCDCLISDQCIPCHIKYGFYIPVLSVQIDHRVEQHLHDQQFYGTFKYKKGGYLKDLMARCGPASLFLFIADIYTPHFRNVSTPLPSSFWSDTSPPALNKTLTDRYLVSDDCYMRCCTTRFRSTLNLTIKSRAVPLSGSLSPLTAETVKGCVTLTVLGFSRDQR